LRNWLFLSWSQYSSLCAGWNWTNGTAFIKVQRMCKWLACEG
jgi:hypothetical protein